LLEVVAASVSGSGKILATMDAGRGEVYIGEYVTGTTTVMLSEQLLTRQEMLVSANHHKIATPDPGIAEFARAAGLTVTQIERPQSDAIVRLAWHKLEKNETVSPEALEANYIRRSDAEIFSKNTR
jgi:tRNA threonylcarbamoyladenosine biosynthesis protein TsaB